MTIFKQLNSLCEDIVFLIKNGIYKSATINADGTILFIIGGRGGTGTALELKSQIKETQRRISHHNSQAKQFGYAKYNSIQTPDNSILLTMSICEIFGKILWNTRHNQSASIYINDLNKSANFETFLIDNNNLFDHSDFAYSFKSKNRWSQLWSERNDWPESWKAAYQQQILEISEILGMENEQTGLSVFDRPHIGLSVSMYFYSTRQHLSRPQFEFQTMPLLTDIKNSWLAQIDYDKLTIAADFIKRPPQTKLSTL